MEGLPRIAIGRPNFDFERGVGGEGLNVTLTGSSSAMLRQLAEDTVRILSGVEGLSGVVSEAGAGDQEVQLRVDRDKASQLGFSTQDVAQAVAIAIRGIDLREYKGEEGEIPVRLQLREEDRKDITDLRDFKLRNAAGQDVPLMAMVRLSETSGPTEIRASTARPGCA
jgi:HAE1 family hydrophobic/amphiphilic exporter-1